MWKCSKCQESVEDSFDICWSCGTSRDGTADETFQRASRAEGGQPRITTLSCTRCDRALQYVGARRFHEGTNWGVLGELGEFFVKRERFDVYVCPRCGGVELFVDGIGEPLRSEPDRA